MQDNFGQQPAEQPRVTEKLQNYGPTIVGAVIILIVLVGGWFVWQRVQGTKTTKTQVVQQNPSPTSTLPIDKSTPPTQSPQTGITELPKAGFPTQAWAALMLILLSGGIVLKNS